MKFFSVSETMAMETAKLELGYLVGKFELQGLSNHEHAKMKLLFNECQQFYGGDDREVIKGALHAYSTMQVKNLFKEVVPNDD